MSRQRNSITEGRPVLVEWLAEGVLTFSSWDQARALAKQLAIPTLLLASGQPAA